MLLIQNLLNGQEFDDAFGSFVKRGVFVVAESDEEPALSAAFAFVGSRVNRLCTVGLPAT